jgi:hypothetical protein
MAAWDDAFHFAIAIVDIASGIGVTPRRARHVALVLSRGACFSREFWI